MRMGSLHAALVAFTLLAGHAGGTPPLDAPWHAENSLRWRALATPGDRPSGFDLLDPQATAVQFTNTLSELRAAENQIRLNGSGVALGDVDGDGWCDIYLCGLENPNRLFRNRGDWTFEDITQGSGTSCEGQFSTGATFGDLDGDGDLDLLVNGIGSGTRLFLNGGQGHFSEKADSGLRNTGGATSLALADVDGDGDLDLYVCNYRTTTIRSTGFAVLRLNGKRTIQPQDRDRLEYTLDGRIIEHGEPDVLYLNEGQGVIRPVSWTDGRFRDEAGKPLQEAPRDWGLTALFRDLNADGLPDLYVCNDFQSPDRIWLGRPGGNFQAAPGLMLRHTPTFSMSADVADINRDGLDDLFAADMLNRRIERRLMKHASTDIYPHILGAYADRLQVDRNTLQLNRGNGTYADIAAFAGLEATDWTWSAAFLDVDLDGYEDLLCTTGHAFDIQDQDAEERIRAKGPWSKEQIPMKLLMYPRRQEAKLAFRNLGDLTFQELGSDWGWDQKGVAHGMGFADLDNDGDLDVVVNNLNAPAGLYRNRATGSRIAIQLRGSGGNSAAIGAKIRVSTTGLPSQQQEIMGGGRYLAGDQALRVFAARSNAPVRANITWRSGQQSVFENLTADRTYEFDEPVAAAQPAPPDSIKTPASWFADVSDRLAFRGQEMPFDDFARQPLLGRRLSELGPGVAWADLNQDGSEDLVVGAGRGGTIGLFLSNGRGQFLRQTNGIARVIPELDLTGLAVVPQPPAGMKILAGISSWEMAPADRPAVVAFSQLDSTLAEIDPTREAITGPLAVADVDGDGDLDLFVGGRAVPGRWPKAAPSRLFRNTQGKWILDAETSRDWTKLGLVSGAVFTDYDNDGDPDLALAVEYGPIRVFRNEQGRFREVTAELGFSPQDDPIRLHGGWTGITAADLNGDGRMDLIASNRGLNDADRRGQQSDVFFGEGEADEGWLVLEALRDPATGSFRPLRPRQVALMSFPWIAEALPSYAAYNVATVDQVFGKRMNRVQQVSARWNATTAFLNLERGFIPKALPAEAQFAPAFGIGAADFDGDGIVDLFLAQNDFGGFPIDTRQDAGCGLLLKGMGDGRFRPLLPKESGIAMFGEGRGTAVGDFDGDGRMDLVVAQQSADLRLFRNQIAKPGLRIRLAGPAGNPHAVGAQVRLHFRDHLGPVHEVHDGSGYWSVDSAVLVIGSLEVPDAVEVRWPSGAPRRYPLVAGEREVTLNP